MSLNIAYENYQNVCLIEPRTFRMKESVEKSAKAVCQYFQENPNSDYVAFNSWTKTFSDNPKRLPTRLQLVGMQRILEFAELIPPVAKTFYQELLERRKSRRRVYDHMIDVGLPEKVVFYFMLWIKEKNPIKDLFDNFKESFFKDSPITLESLIDALIRHRKEFNATILTQIAEEYAEEKLLSTCKEREAANARRKRKVRANSHRGGPLDWDGEIDFVKLFDLNNPKAPNKRRRNFYSDIPIEYDSCDELLESQVVAPPEWYVTELWRENRFPGIRLPPDMFARYLKIYKKKRIKGSSKRKLHRGD